MPIPNTPLAEQRFALAARGTVCGSHFEAAGLGIRGSARGRCGLEHLVSAPHEAAAATLAIVCEIFSPSDSTVNGLTM